MVQYRRRARDGRPPRPRHLQVLNLAAPAAATADAPSNAMCRLPAMWRRRRPSPRRAPFLRQCRPKHGPETPPSLSLSPLPPINPNPIKHSLTGCRTPSPPPNSPLSLLSLFPSYPPPPLSLPPTPPPSFLPLVYFRMDYRPEWSCARVKGGRGAASRGSVERQRRGAASRTEKPCLD